MPFKLTALRALLTSCVLLGTTLPAAAQASPASVKAAIERHAQGSVRVDRIEATPVPGIYQVMSEGEIFYADASGRYAFVGGAMIDMMNRQDMTAPVLERLNSIPWQSLPLKHAIVDVHGNGRRKVAVFEDPLCPICRAFTKFLDQIDDVTIYRFVFPVIDPQSAQIARGAWCSPNRKEAWATVMRGRRVEGPENCDVSGMLEIVKFGEKYNIGNTPTVVLGNGKRLVGATPPEQFIAELEAAGQ